MKITFDPAKRGKTLRERLIDFRDAEAVFGGLTYSIEDLRFPIRSAASLPAVCWAGGLSWSYGRRSPKPIDM